MSGLLAEFLYIMTITIRAFVLNTLDPQGIAQYLINILCKNIELYKALMDELSQKRTKLLKLMADIEKLQKKAK